MTGPYTVEIARRAQRSMRRLERRDQQRIRATIDLLAQNPRPPGCAAMVGEPNTYRVRVGVYRIVYEVPDDRLVIQVVRVGHGRDVYRT